MRRKKVQLASSSPEKQNLSIGIYFGEGASHSWTWLVDCFESQGFYNLVFLDDKDVRQGNIERTDVFAMGGGDAFAMAEALWYPGARAIAGFIERGGLYLGFCAGAYLLLDMDEFPLSIFSLTDVKVKNIVEQLPKALALPHKLFTPYGSRYVLHPVREEVVLQTMSKDIFKAKEMVAPLYGGPPMEIGGGEEALAIYQDFTADTIFLVEEQMAREMMLGTVAACRKKIGKGWAYLFGPHFENPLFPEANAVLGRLISEYAFTGAGKPAEVDHVVACFETGGQLVHKIKSHLSNCRIVGFSMEFMEVNWEIGHKIYEPEKILVFLDSMWKRYDLASQSPAFCAHPLLPGVEQGMREVVDLLRLIKSSLRENRDSLPLAKKMFPLLRDVTGNFLKAYFYARVCFYREEF